MTYLEKLLDGATVEWRPLGEVCHYEQPAKYIVASTDYKDSFPTPVLTAGKTFILGYTDEVEGIYPASEHPVIIFDDFTGALRWIDFDFKVKSSAMKMITSEDESVVLLRFIFYWLSHLPSLFVAHDHQRLWLRKYAPLLIPLPPLAVQERIVEILDKFTALEAELEAELEARGRQFRYYRNKLLRFGEEVEWRPLGEVADVSKLAGFEFTKYVKYSDIGTIIAIRGLNVKGHLDLSDVKYMDNSNFEKLSRSKLYSGDMLFTYVGTVGNVAIVDEDDRFYLAPNVCRIRFTNGNILPRFMFYYFQTSRFRREQMGFYMEKSTMQNLTMGNIRKFLIPLPPLAVQEQIVAVLDKFYTLVHSIREGLPAEIALRQRQYRYYRHLLLDFPKPRQ